MEQTNFNPTPPTIMHIDLNSCFASVEQQANPLLRGRPVAVAAYTTGNGCILALSVEAKRLGMKTGMRVRDGKALCPGLVILPPDPDKYRFVNQKLRALLSQYSPYLSVESIDEMVMDVRQTSILAKALVTTESHLAAMVFLGKEIKTRIKREIGEWLTVSIGIAPNRYLAKVASGLHKPDGLDVITKDTIEDVFSRLALEDLCGIKTGNAGRLAYAGITTPLTFYHADAATLKRALRSITGYHWWLRLHGWEDGSMYKTFSDNSKEENQKSFGQSHALGKPHTPRERELHQILCQLVVKMARRLREAHYTAQGVGVSCLFTDYSHWGYGHTYPFSFYTDGDFYERAVGFLQKAPEKLVRILAVSCFDLGSDAYEQTSMFEKDDKKRKLTKALDTIADRWGDFVVTPGRMLSMEQRVLDRIAFGRVKLPPLD